MRALVTSLTIRELAWHQVPAVVVSLVIAEVFYKFGSFSLECVAFLATWYVVDLLISVSTKRVNE